MKIIEPNLSDGTDLGMPGQLAQFLYPQVSCDCIHITGMDAHSHAYIRYLLRDGEQLAGIVEIDRWGHHPRNTRSAGALEHSRQVRVKLAAAKVSMGIEEHQPAIRVAT
jgi:hypothetical protein